MYLDYIKAKVDDAIFVIPQNIISCSEAEIAYLEAQLDIKLPHAYKEFLLWMGHSGGVFLRGTDCFYKDLFNLKEWAIELLEENNFLEHLPEDAFVFLMHQGYQFMFLRTSEGENPPIYNYIEGTNKSTFDLSFRTFTEFLAIEIEYTLKLLQDGVKL